MASPLDQLRELREQSARDLEDLEAKIAQAEYEYLTCESSQLGNVLKGFEGFMSSKETVRRKPRAPKLEERIFSLSSKKSIVSKEYEQHLLQQDQAEQVNTHGGVPKKVGNSQALEVGCIPAGSRTEDVCSETACSEAACREALCQKGKENDGNRVSHAILPAPLDVCSSKPSTLAPNSVWLRGGAACLAISDPLPAVGTLPNPESRSTSSGELKSVENLMSEVTSRVAEGARVSSHISTTPANPQLPGFCMDDWFLPMKLPFKARDYFKDKKKYWKRLKQIITGQESARSPAWKPTYENIEAGPSVYPAKKYCDITGFEAPYTDPKTKIRYATAELYPVVRSLPTDVVQACLAIRMAQKAFR